MDPLKTYDYLVLARRKILHWSRPLSAEQHAQVFDDEQVRHRQLRVDMQRADGGAVATIASPLRLQHTPPVYRRAPPVLGDCTDEVLTQTLGCSADELAAYRADRII